MWSRNRLCTHISPFRWNIFWIIVLCARVLKGRGDYRECRRGCFWVWLQISIGHCLVNGFHCGAHPNQEWWKWLIRRCGRGIGERVNPSDLSRINLSASRQIGIRRARCKTQLHGPTDLLWSTVGGRRTGRKSWAGQEDLLADVTEAVAAAYVFLSRSLAGRQDTTAP